MERSRSPRRFNMVPLHPFVGARVEGINVSKVSQQDIADVWAPALEKYGLLLFSNQDISPKEFFNFMKCFPDVDLDELSVNPFAQGDPACLPELPTVRAIGTPDSDPSLHRGATPEENRIGKEWHTDGCGITGLLAAQVPLLAPKRTTLWASGYRAWELLDEEMKQKAMDLQAHFGPGRTMEASLAEIYRRGGRTNANGLKLLREVERSQLSEEELRRREHPTNLRRYLQYDGCVVKRHPSSYRATLWSTPIFLESCSGMSWEQGQDLMEQILLPGTSGDAVYVHEWSLGDFVLWDNRSTLHSTTEVVDAPQLMYQAFLRTKMPMRPL
ncbi:unnamed protein product [Effrenium voratum]|nr:unnamed protein product [Effrenium voratum]